jgi:SAM-dependent methyltransferase
MNYEKGVAYKQQNEIFVKKLKKAYHTKNILPILLKNFDSKQKIKILEFGPVLGVMADILHSNYPLINYTAIDIDQTILDRIKNKYNKSITKQIKSSKDLCAFLTDNKFDLIIALDVWEHIPPSELDIYTRKSLDCLSKNGLFIAQVPNWGCPFSPNVIFAGDTTHHNPFNEISAKQLLMRNGVDIENIEILPYHFPLNGLINLFRSIIRFLLLIAYKFILPVLGLQMLKVCTPNLIMLAKNRQNSTPKGNC